MRRISIWALSLLPVLILALCGNAIYDWLLEQVTAGQAHALIALTPEAVFMHRAKTIGSLVLLGLCMGLALRHCLKPASGLHRTLSLLTLAAVAASATTVTIIKLRDHVQSIAGAQIIDSSIEIGAIPLYLTGVIPAACLLAGGVLLALVFGKRPHA